MGLVGFLLVLCAGGLLGWIVRGRNLRGRYRMWPVEIPPPAVVYEEGFQAGLAEAARVRGTEQPRATIDAPAGEVPLSIPSSELHGAVTGPAGTPHGRLGIGGQDDQLRSQANTTPAVAAEPPPSAEELAAAKAARDLRNINIALYSASLLLVAAGGLFIGAAVPGPARAATISAVVALFYGGGLVLHSRLPRLRPAAVAFAGTGLALLPVAGLLFGVLTGQGSTAWFTTAVIGTAAYVLAAVRLQSRVVAYLTLPFFLSIALSSVSLIGGALVWYFTCSIGVAAILAVLVRLSPRWLPGVIARAIVDSHRLLTPIALVASLVLGGLLSEADRSLLWVVGALYYAALLAFLDVATVQNLYALRVVGSIAALLTASAMGLSPLWSLAVLAGVLGLQIIGLLLFPDRTSRLLAGARPSGAFVAPGAKRGMPAVSSYRLDLLVTFAVMTFTAAVVILASSWARTSPGVDGPDTLIPVLLVLLLGMATAVRTRGAFELLAAPGVLLGAMTPSDNPWRTEIVLVLAAAYLVARATSATGLQRERFVLAARGAVTLLMPVAVLVHLPTPVLQNATTEDVAGLAFVAALAANQLAEVIRARKQDHRQEHRQDHLQHHLQEHRRALNALAFAVICSTSGLSLLAAAALAGEAEAAVIAATGLWTVVVVGAATPLVLRPAMHAPAVDGGGATAQQTRRRAHNASSVPAGGWRRRAASDGRHLIEAIGPVSIIVAAMAGPAAGFATRSYELLLAVAVVYCGLMARRSHGLRSRGAYLLASQLAFTGLTAVTSADLELSVHGMFSVVAASVALQETVRVLLRYRLRDIGLQASSAWLSLALLAALPVVYAAVADSGPRLGVVTLHLLLLGAVAALLFVLQRKDAAAYPTLYAGAALLAVLSGVIPTARAGWMPAPPLTEPAAAVLAAACVAVVVLLRLRSADTRLRMPCWVGAALFGLEGAALGFGDGLGWDRVLVATVLAGAMVSLSRREAVPWLDAGGAVAVVVSATAVVEELTRRAEGTLAAGATQLLLGAVLAAALLYGVRAVLLRGRDDHLRGRILGVAAAGWAGFAAAVAMAPDESAVAASAILVAAVLLGGLEVPAGARSVYGEAAFLVLVAAVQRVAWLVTGGLDLFWAAQWWVVALALLAAYSFAAGAARRGPLWLMAAAILLSGTGLLTVVDGTTGAQVWSLCGHVALLLAGVAFSRRMFSLWGAIGIALALLWFLRGFTFLLLTVAALLLLAFAVWKLNNQTRGKAPDTGSVPPAPAGPGMSGVAHITRPEDGPVRNHPRDLRH